MVTAVIGWGSLLWSPRNLSFEPPWHEDGPLLPIEFARRASDGRVTLVAVDGYRQRIHTYWSRSLAGSAQEAAVNLAERERAPLEHIHSHDDRGPRDAQDVRVRSDTAAIIEAWVKAHPAVTAAVWTGLPVTRFRPDATLPDQVLRYLSRLTGPTHARAREYVERAPAAVDTPVRRHVEAELGWRRRH